MSSNYIKDKFWSEDPNILLLNSRLTEFFPTPDMTLYEKINAITRLSFYISIVMFGYSGNINYLYIFVTTLFFTYLIYKNQKIIPKPETENYEGIQLPVNYIPPTKNNPFMNPLISDIIANPNFKALSRKDIYPNKKILKEINNKFNINLYRDLSDVFEKENSQRQFYTVPSTTIPNSQKKFANWLYNTPPSCKDGNSSQCVANLYNPLESRSRDPGF